MDTSAGPSANALHSSISQKGIMANDESQLSSSFESAVYSSQLTELCNDPLFPCFASALTATPLGSKTQKVLPSVALSSLSQLLLRPCLTLGIAKIHRPLLLDLVSRWLALPSSATSSSSTELALVCPCCGEASVEAGFSASPKHDREGMLVDRDVSTVSSSYQLLEHFLLAFSRLIPVSPQIFVIATACFEKLALSPIDMFRRIHGYAPNSPKLLNIAQSLYILTHTTHVSTFTAMWDFAPLFELLHVEYESMSHVVIAYLAHTMANVLGMTDEERTAILSKFLTSETILNDSRICMLSFLEEEQIQLNRAEMFRPLPSNNGTIICNITALDLSPFVVDVAGILLPKPNLLDASSSQPKQKLVWTETTRRNLNRIAVSVSIGAPVLVTGAAGVGKTSLVEEVARMVGQKDLLKIHLGDQTDSKILLGTYVCQNEPGSFRWQPGILTTAVMQGRWVLIEDLDLAPLEVVSVLIPLLETGHLFIPARGEKVRARQGFQLFATQTVSSNASKFGISSRGGSGGSGEMGAALWNRIAVDALPTTEMVQVVSALFPNLGAVFSPLIVKTFEGLVTMFRSALGVNRVVSFRDVIKWCYRLDRLHASVFVEDAMKMGENFEGSIESVSLQARECLFREAVECFTMMLMDRKIRDRAMSIVADILVIPPTRLEFYSDHYLPVLSVAEKGSSKKGINTVAKVTVGRTSLSFTKTPAKTFETASTFANTTLSLRLLEKLAVCVSMQESVLLTGETGTGKTTIIQQLASMCGKSLTVINMSQQSDSTDLLGGFKPVEATMIAMPMLERFEALFSRTFSATANAAFLESVRSAFIKKKWDVLKLGFGNSVRMADKVLGLQKSQDGEPQAKKSKKLQSDPSLVADWEEFSTMVKSFSAQLDHLKNSFLFSFVEGTLVKAITRGDWILLDEVNLASAETLESLSGILQSSTGSILLLERGDTEPVKRHPDFRLFACMNPANDAGKRDLPPGLLSRFTEMWVDSPDTVPQDLALIINRHLHSCLPPPTQGGNAMVSYISEFHTSVKAAAESGFLVDGSGHKVCINLRTLTRALGFASACTPKYGLQRSVYEGCQMTYATILGKDSLEVIRKLFEKHLLNGIKNMGSFLKNIPKIPDSEENSHILFGAYWIRRGPLEVNDAPKYVLTPSVDMNLSRLARAVMSSKFPVLIQGPTSAGKTSMVEYLATRTGHRFIRVNNHEHTDLQEYIGTYVSNSEGKLVFREGVLVEALRKGHWIVLDELNLAPSDVLESLNRLLDDNRELLIPETQEVVRPHPGFMLFATQNPPGLYGGRKQLSRAFRSRFIELHFDDIPEPELSIILEKRCRLPPSYSAKIVATYKGLQNARQRSRIFEGKHAFATLRDLFRWGNRPAENAQELAEHGFMVLAEKSRRDDEKDVVRDVLEQTFRLKIDPTALYDREWRLFMGNVTANSDFVKDIVWTNAMKRLFVLVLKCITNTEPILLVGETGCGKTTVCQILTTLMGVNLQIVNAHAGSETSDFIGSMRPVRGRDRTVAETLEAITALWEKIAAHTEEESDFMSSTNINSLFTEYNGNLQVMIDLVKSRINQLDPQDSWNAQLQTIESLFIQSKKMFEWSDGPLVNAMRVGEAFLLDEISLADDSVLERLNSVLESERLLVLAERGAVNADGEDSNDPTHSHIEEIRGHQNFSFMATMNPGGDYGKKELSPALRNRFTELWVPSIGDKEDLKMIINQRLGSLASHSEQIDVISELLLNFLDWFAGKLGMVRTSIVSLRDIMAWVAFITTMVKQSDPTEASSILLLGKSIFHGGCMVLLDGIGVNPLFGSMLGSAAAATFRKDCSQRLAEDIYAQFLSQESITLDQFLIEISFFVDKVHIVRENDMFGIPPFLVKCGPEARKDIKFALQAPTTSINALRVLRALRLSKPVLLEGSPGVGKSSLISSLATTCGYSLCRINLSEQTDLMDLFGSDLPVEGGKGGEFAWRDGPFLSAMKTGQWVLLDELNLATQQVLEGLNACLDHRASVYIPELNRSFDCHKDFRVFAAQNPQNQGGGRKGLPKSFVNRFTQVYIEALTGEDMEFIIMNLHPEVEPSVVKQMIGFNQAMHHETMVQHSFGSRGSPWEFNLRDTLRWIELVESGQSVLNPQLFLNMMYCQRMRTDVDEAAVVKLFGTFFDAQEMPKCSLDVTPSLIRVGSSTLKRVGRRHPQSRGYVTGDKLEILSSQLPVLESLVKCVEMSWMAILCGSSSSGKTSMVRLLAKLAGQQLDEFSMNSGIDAVELLGGFEQVDLNRREQSIVRLLEHSLDCVFRYVGTSQLMVEAEFFNRVFGLQTQLRDLCQSNNALSVEVTKAVLNRLEKIIEMFGESLETFLVKAGCKLPFEILEMCDQLQRLRESGVHGQFEWIDGTLIKALEEGRWILIDNANMCPASVLDRLNHLLEPNGVLIVNERGLVNGQIKVIQPHPNFRMFMTMDPHLGEISRAMRNRGVELFIRPPENDDASTLVSSLLLQDIVKLLNTNGLPGAELPKSLLKLHKSLASLFRRLHISFDDSNTMLIKFARLTVERLERGVSWANAAKQSIMDVYVDLSAIESLPEDVASPLLEAVSDVINYTPHQTSQNVDIATGSWPVRVSGRFVVEESILSRTSLEASLILKLSTAESQVDLNVTSNISTELQDTLITPMPKVASLLRSSCMQFVQQSLVPVSSELKSKFLQHILQKYATHISTEQLQIAIKLLESEKYMEPLEAKSLKYGILLRLKEFELIESIICSNSVSSILSQSKLFFDGQTSEHNLAHPVFKYLYPFIRNLRECMSSIVSESLLESYDDLQQVLYSAEYLLRLLDSESLNPTDLVFAFQSTLLALKKSSFITAELSRPSFAATEKLLDSVEGCYSTLDIRAFESLSALWRNSSIKTLRNSDLIHLELEFTSLSSRVSLQGKNVKDAVAHPLMLIDSKIKHSILEAVSTLYYLDESSSSETSDMQKMICLLPTEIAAQFDELELKAATIAKFFEVDVPLQESFVSLESLGSRGVAFGLMPITEIKSLRSQALILMRLTELVLNSVSMAQKKTFVLGLVSEIRDLIKYEIEETLNMSQNLQPLQRIVWMLNSDWIDNVSDEQFIPQIKDVLFEAAYRWHQRLWQNSCTVLLASENYKRDILICHGNVHETPKTDVNTINVNVLTGPEILRQSMNTKMGMHLLGSMRDVPIYGFKSKVNQIQKLAKVLNEPLVPDYVYESLKGDIHMVFLLLDQIITGHEHYFVADTFNTLVASVSKLRSTLLTDPVAVSSNIQGILGLLKSIPEKQLKYLNSVFEMFSVISVSGLSVSSVGKIWVSISMAFLRSYLPSTPIDPALSAQTQLDILSSISERIKSDILVRLELDFVSQSDSQAAAHDTQLDSLRDIHISQRKIRSRMVYRPEQSQIGAIVNDLSHLGNNVLRDEIIALSLTDDVKQKIFLQESLQAFIQRMETKYPLYRDILQPVFLSVYQLRLGLSSLAADQDDYYEISVEVNRLMGSLLEFTGFLKSEDLTGHSFSAALKDISRISSKENEISTLISVIRRFCWGIEYQQHISRTDLEIIHDWFNELSEKWVETEALVSQHEREKDELYKFKERTHEVLTEAEIEEKDLLEIFPDFYDEFEGEAQNDDDPHIKKLPPLVSTTPTEPPKAPVRLDDSIAFEVREMHEHMFRATSSTLTHEQLRQSYQKVYMSTFEASAKVFDTTINPLDFKYEVTSRAGKIVVAQMRLDALTALDEEVKVSDNFDFYRDHNIAEAQRLQSMLKTLDEMVGRLLDEWPENSTLLHIRVMNNRLASFSITSPIMKLLTGVELLFQKCHEWETYASSAVSLKSHLEQMTNLIVRWRKLELQSWKNLLKNEDRLADTKSSKLWFHLFRSLIGPALTYANDDTRGEAAEADLVSIIDQLILSSSIGEFQGRLNLIISFHKHLAAIRKEARFTKSIDVMMNILWNIHRYYSQFSDYIKSHVEAQRKPIVKELDGYVRIATWKDVNVYALKESSKKSHYHLHKFVKKYREILSLPVKDVIVSHAQEVVLESGVVLSSKKKTVAHSLYSPTESSLISGSEVISNSVSQKDCAKYLARMRNLSRALISDTHNSETQEGVEDLVTTIIDRIQFFQTPPEVGAVVKGQRMIRKKALVDLLKYLEYLGLSPNTSVRHSNNQNPTYLYSRAKLDMTNSLVDSLRLEGMDTSMNATSSTLYKQSDNYFFKILTRMGSVRTSAITYNKDLSDREMSKSVSFLEDLLHMIIDERNILSIAVASISAPAIESARRCYVQLQGADKGRFSPLKADYSVTESVIESHKRALDETDAFITQALIVMDCIGKATSLPQEAMTSVRAVQTSMERSRSEVNRIFSTYCARAAGSMVPFLVTTEIQTALAAASECLSQALSDIQTIALTYPSISWLFENICSRVSLAIHSLSDSKLAMHEEKVSSDVADIASKCDSLVDSILVAFQDLRPKECTADAKNPNDPTTLENTPEIDEFGLEKGNIRNSHSTFCKTFQTDNPRLSNLLVSIESILHDITLVSESNLEACSRLLGHVYPLLQQYLLMYQFKIYEFIGFHKSICKLTYVLSNSFAILFKKGFCIPKEEDDQEDNNQEEEAGTGMGIGEGEGEKDVSNEIEDESQVEGLKNDSKEAPKPEKKMKEEKDGVEMEGDFDGVLEDVSDDGENDDEDDDKDEKELDEEQMGDLDRDLADVVDEKLWDGDEEKQDQDAKTERDSKAESKPGETDLVAKEEDSKGPKEPPQPQDKKDAKEDESKDEEGEDGEDGDEDEPDKMPEDDHINDMENQYEDNNGVKPTSSIEDDESQEKGDEEDNMDLPEDLNLDDEKDGGGKEDEGFDDMNLDKDDRPDSPINEDQDVDDMEEEQFPTEEADAQMDRLDENAEDEEMAEQEDVEPTAGDDPVPEQTPKENQEVLNTEPDEEKEGEEEEEDKPQTNARDKNLGNADTQTTKDKVVNAAAENDNDQKDNSNDANATADSGQDSQKKDGGRNDVANERESQDQNESEHQKNQDSDFNPHRSLGDATKKWINRFKNLFDKDTTQEEKPQPDAVQKDENEMEDGENQDFEFVENDESSFDAQVLHAANTEQMNQMDQKALAEEKKDDDLMDVDEEEAVEDQEEDETKNEAPNNSEKNEDDGKTENQGKVKNGPKLGQLSDKDENPGDKDDEAAEEEGDSKDTDAKMDDELDDDKKHVHDPSNEDAEDELELEPLDEAALQELRQQLQESTEEWRKTGRDLTEARTLWRAYSSLTRELSFALCESLRLILEPTLATKLKGDYRAGKRLNMRKVIAYIASQFKKDKIWLRRTRPSKRTYQIMISIDDSKSMAESKSIELAFESLSLISKALTQLEVGEISVVSFGEDVRLLHPFDKPFSDEAGAEVIHDFTFNQDGTHVRKMMETTTDILKTARQSSQGSAELWQLQIIISDGILEDHAAVRALVRQAANARIMVVFVILDKRGDRDSILRMTNVTYTSAGLQMSRYMDTFPFDFYVVLNRIEDLPEVLSDVLRQYFLFVSL